MTPRKPRRLMLADRRAQIARELVAVAPDAPLWLRDMAGMSVLDIPSCQQLPLTSQPPHQPTKGQP